MVSLHYPPELLAERRGAFAAQLDVLDKRGVANSQPEEEMIGILEYLRPIRFEYPLDLLKKHRTAFVNQVEKRTGITWWHILHSAIQSSFIFNPGIPKVSTPGKMLRLLIIAGILTTVVSSSPGSWESRALSGVITQPRFHTSNNSPNCPN